ncbi:hypothetical protein [Variovorax sp. W2I14]|uniref:hypothetical protein n=1 Tax=Variovorax sp. W2I14 TaxID=3042290 RepID=UPI003D1942A3
MPTDINDTRLSQIKAVLDGCALLKFTQGSANDPKLVDGLYYDHKMLKTGTWVLSVYRNVKTEGNDFEMAVDPGRLAWPDDDQRPARRWLEAQKERLQHLESGVHSTKPPNAVRIGFKYDAALQFVSALRQELTLSKNRWQLPQPATVAPPHGPVEASTTTPPDAAPELTQVQSIATDNPTQVIANRMLQTVKATCAQSGSQSTVIAKNKEWRFRDDEHFLSEVNALLDLAQGRCSLSNVQLDLTGDHPELSPSLDRKRSDGHYEPGNLQIVARFINRWKSDMSDDDFLHLLRTVRSA